MNQLKAAGQAATPEHSTGELVKLVAEQVSVLVRDELKLAQLEMSGKAKQAGKGAGMLGGGGARRPVRRGLPDRLRDHRDQPLAAGVAGGPDRRRGPAGRRRRPGGARPQPHAQGHAAVPTEAVDSVKTDVAEIKERAHR